MTSERLEPLSKTQPNKTVVFYSPIEGRDILVRSGHNMSTNSFLHSILSAYSKNYLRMKTKDQIQTIQKLIVKLQSRLSQDYWEHKIVPKILPSYSKYLKQVLIHLYQYIQEDEYICKEESIQKAIQTMIPDVTTKERYRVISVLLPFDPLVDLDYNSKTHKQYREKFLKHVQTTMETEFAKYGSALEPHRKQFCLERMIHLMEKVLDYVSSTLYSDWKKQHLQNPHSIYQFISETIHANIYLIDHQTRMPYISFPQTQLNKHSIVILTFPSGHCEVVGKLLPRNRIQREFEHTDSLIKRFNTFLYHPDIVKDHYPNLVPYLKLIKAKIQSMDKLVNLDQALMVDTSIPTESQLSDCRSRSKRSGSGERPSSKSHSPSHSRSTSKSHSPSHSRSTSKSHSPSQSRSSSKSHSPSPSSSSKSHSPSQSRSSRSDSESITHGYSWEDWDSRTPSYKFKSRSRSPSSEKDHQTVSKAGEVSIY